MRSSSLLRLGLVLAALFAQAPAFAQPAASAEPLQTPARSAAEQLAARRQARPRERANACATCHASLSDEKLRAPAREYAASVHRDPRIGCVGCHRGDPEDPTVRAHSAPGFLPRPAFEVVIGICGDCHADAHLVRGHDPKLQVDQAALYRLSLHSTLARAGDRNAPTCATCHGSHGIEAVQAPTAVVNRRNVAGLCGKCHADKEMMRPYGAGADQVTQWKRSQHAQAFAAGSPTAPTCTGCHSAHAGESAAGATARVCGGCHEEQLTYVRQSPHGKPFEQLGMSECTPCHGEHDVARTSWLAGLAPDSACSRCHARDDKARRAADELAALLRQVRDRADGARAALAKAEAEHLFLDGRERALDELHTDELRLRTQVHKLDPAQLQVLAGAVFESAERATRLADAAHARRKNQRLNYTITLSIAGLLFALLLAKVIQIDRRRRRSEP